MKPVFQTLFGNADAPRSERGNCMPASIASILELPLDDVPHFYALHDNKDPDDADRDYRMIADWLNARGLCTVTFTPPIHPLYARQLEGAYCIATGKSPRFPDCYHAAVGVIRNGQVEKAHDPHPSGDWFTGGVEYFEIICRVPSERAP